MDQEGILGVLGGMGPQATNTFYQRLIDRTQAESDQEHLQVLLWSDAKIPDRTAGILAGPEEAEKVYQALLAGARLLEGAGCTVLAIPCNTSHYFADRLQGELKIPLIHMIRETVAAIAAMGKKTRSKRGRPAPGKNSARPTPGCAGPGATAPSWAARSCRSSAACTVCPPSTSTPWRCWPSRPSCAAASS